MNGAPAHSAHVLFLRLRGFAQLPVAEQARRHGALQARLAALLASWPEAERLVLDDPEGLAVLAWGDVRRAWRLARDAAGEDLTVAVHSGPVQALAAGVGETRVRGEALETAAALAQREDAALLATQAFRAALAAAGGGAADTLRPAGELVDERLRSQPVHAFDAGAGRQRGRRRALLGGAALFGLLGLGWAVRDARHARLAAARRPALVRLAIRPVGEVWVDGTLQGNSPPLQSLALAPGAHSIEIRHARAKPLKMQVQLQPGEELRLEHEFVLPPAPPAPRRRQPDLLDRARSWFRQQQR